MDNDRGYRARLHTYFVYIVASRSRIYIPVLPMISSAEFRNIDRVSSKDSRGATEFTASYITRSSATSVLRLRERRKSNTGTEKKPCVNCHAKSDLERSGGIPLSEEA